MTAKATYHLLWGTRAALPNNTNKYLLTCWLSKIGYNQWDEENTRRRGRSRRVWSFRHSNHEHAALHSQLQECRGEGVRTKAGHHGGRRGS